MAKAPSSISTPSLHTQWSDAKKEANTKAQALDKKNKDKTQATLLSALEKKGFKKDLGPNLDKWVKLYPDFPKMDALLSSKIEPALKAYAKAVKDASLDASIAKVLLHAIKSIGDAQAARAKTAEALIASDVGLAVKESKKKTPPPIVVFKHDDVGRVVAATAGALKNIALDKDRLSVEVIIGDPEILDRFPEGKEYINQSQKIKDAGDFSRLVDDIAAALKLADKNVGKGQSLAGEQKTFAAAVDKAIADAIDRATEEAGRLGKLKGKARWANVKRGGKLVLAFAGAAAGVAGLALTPFTFGVSTVAGAVGLAKAGVEIGKQLADIASSAEQMANGIAADLNTLKKQYAKWLADPEVKKAGGVSNKMGMAELGKRGLNALAPTMLTTLKSVKGDIGTYEEYINNLEVKADKLGDQISSWLVKQGQADKAFKDIQKLGRDALTDKETATLATVMKTLDKTASTVDSLLKKTIALNQRVKRNQTDAKRLSKQFAAISVKNPMWSEVGSTLFEVTSSVAFVLAGNVNAPDSYKFAKEAMDILGAIDTARDQLLNAEALAEDLHDSYKERKARIKA